MAGDDTGDSIVSNLPEAIAGSTGMQVVGWSKQKIILLWLFIALVCFAATVAGLALFAGVFTVLGFFVSVVVVILENI